MRYRIHRYRYKAWEILVEKEIGRGPRKGELEWQPYKYPGALQFVANALLDEALDDVTVDSVEELTAAVKGAQEKVLRALEKVTYEGSSAVLEWDDD